MVSHGYFFIKHRQKLVGGQFSCFLRFLSQKNSSFFLDTYLISSTELFGDFLLRRLGRFLGLLVGFSRAWFDALELLMRACSVCRCRFSTVNCLGGGGWGDVTLFVLKKIRFRR